MKTYYKVFSKNSQRSGTTYGLEYKLNEWTDSWYSNSRLFVFDSLNAAKSYINFYGDNSEYFDIYECHCKGVIKNANGYEYSRNSHADYYSKFWEMVNDNLKKKKKWNTNLDREFTLYQHQGVCFAKQVKLIKKI
jgi:hypothetical protein